MVRSKFMTSMRGLVGACLLALTVNAEAAPLDLTLLDSPDIASFFIETTYNASTDQLMATGFALSFDAGAESVFGIANGLYTLEATINEAGELQGGTVTIHGTIAALGYTSGTLLEGTLVDFGFSATDPMEFIFTPMGGDLALEYGDFGGIIMGQTGFNGSFSHNFGNGTAVADVAAIPVPAAVWLMMSALAGLISIRRR